MWLAKVSERGTISKTLTWSIRALSISHLSKIAADEMLAETAMSTSLPTNTNITPWLMTVLALAILPVATH